MVTDKVAGEQQSHLAAAEVTQAAIVGSVPGTATLQEAY